MRRNCLSLLLSILMLILLMLSVPAAQEAEEEPPIIVPAPILRAEITPLSGTVPRDITFRVLEAYHPFGIDSIEVRAEPVDDRGYLTGAPRSQTMYPDEYPDSLMECEMYLTEPGTYNMIVVVHSGPDLPELEYKNWEFAPGACDFVLLEAEYTLAQLDIPEPRPYQNLGYQQPYEPTVTPPGPDAPICVYSLTPLNGPPPLAVDLLMNGCFSPVGAALESYQSAAVPTAGGLAVDIANLEEISGIVSRADFDDPDFRIFQVQANYVLANSPDPLFKYELPEPGCYAFATQVRDNAGRLSRTWFDYINVLPSGYQPPVAALTSTPARLELEEITLLQYMVDIGGDVDAIRGREDELVRVLPRGAVAVTLDASASHDPDGYVANYVWDIYDEGQFNYSTGSDPQLTFFVDAENWPGTSFDVHVLVADNHNYVDTASYTLTVEQQLPFGVKVDVTEMPAGADDDIGPDLGLLGGAG